MPRNLVELEIRGQHLEAKAGFSRRRVYRCCKSLKVLDLSNCKRLRKTPNFNGSRSLETLRFHGCSRLMEIHPSIGNLDRLTELYLYGCKKLMNLPSSICQLKSLRLLNIHRCSSIQTLPVDLGDIRGLKYLNASCTGIKQLPGSVKMLRDLVYLEVGGEAKRSFSRKRVHCIQSLSTFILRLRLTYFKLSEADIPRDIRSLSSLRCFDLSGDSFLCLPFGSVELRFLEYLCLNYYKNLQTIPLVSNLENPEFYEIGNCKKLVDITELDSLSSIEQLNMLNCNALQNPFNEGFFSAFQSRKNWNLGLDIYLQSNEIPDWCSYQVTAPSICFIMPMHNKEYQFLGMIVWCVRKFVNVPSSGTWKGLGFSIAGKMFPDVFSHDDNELPAGHVELSFVFYRSYMQRPFDGQIKCGEKMEVFEVGIENTVKKIGIHLLYLDQQGKVTSLPAIVDQSHSQMKRSREISDKSLSEKEPKKSFNRAYQLNP